VDSSFLNANMKSHFDFLESQLKSSPNGGKYFCGNDLTGADMLMSFPLVAAKDKGKLSSTAYPTLMAYIKLLEENEVYQRCIKKAEELSGEPYKVAP
jgi:glutathione S-transferase